MGDPLKRYLTIENEDDLTRVVFGILELLGPTVLTDVLDLPDQLSDECTVQCHERIDPRAKRIPDVVITDTDATILVEIKRGASLDLSQLTDEHDDLQQFGRGEKRLLFISGHESNPLEEDERGLEQLEWKSWEAIARRLANYEQATLPNTQSKLIALLRKTLEEEGYSPFAGFSQPVLEELPSVLEMLGDYRNQIARFHRKVEGLLADDGLQAKNMWRNGISQDFNQFPNTLQFTSTHLWIAYAEPDIPIRNKGQHYLFAAFCIERPMIRVGYSLSPKRSQENRTALIENADAIVDFVAATNGSLLQTGRNFRIQERFDDKNEMTRLLNDTDTLGGLDRVQIAKEYGPKRLQQETVTNLVADTLIEFHEFTYPRLYP